MPREKEEISKDIKTVIRNIFLIFLFIFYIPYFVLPSYMPSEQVQILDDITKKPIPNALVTIGWYHKERNIFLLELLPLSHSGGSGSPNTCHKYAITQTDQNGQFHIPWHIGFYRNIISRFNVRKPGYLEGGSNQIRNKDRMWNKSQLTTINLRLNKSDRQSQLNNITNIAPPCSNLIIKYKWKKQTKQADFEHYKNLLYDELMKFVKNDFEKKYVEQKLSEQTRWQ